MPAVGGSSSGSEDGGRVPRSVLGSLRRRDISVVVPTTGNLVFFPVSPGEVVLAVRFFFCFTGVAVSGFLGLTVSFAPQKPPAEGGAGDLTLASCVVPVTAGVVEVPINWEFSERDKGFGLRLGGDASNAVGTLEGLNATVVMGRVV